MSVTNTYTPVLLTGDGSEQDFDFGFKIFDASDLVVALVDPDTLVATAQAISTNYTVVIDTAAPGGTVTFLVPPPDGTLVSIRRDVPITQATDIPSGGLFREVQIENALDKEILIAQQLNEKIDRAILQNPYTAAITLVYPGAEANKIIGWDAAGTGLENKTLMDADAQAAAAAAAAEAATSAADAAAYAVEAASQAAIPRVVIIKAIADDETLTTGDGKAYFACPKELNGMNLVDVGASVLSKSLTGVIDISIERGRRTSATGALSYVDMLSVPISIDVGEYDSVNAATAPIISLTSDDIIAGTFIDVLRINVDGAGSAVLGCEARLSFHIP